MARAKLEVGPTAPQNIDQYIAGFSADVQEVLQQVRQVIQKAAPEAEEKISYKMPTFTLGGKYLIYFSAHKKHIGLYPAPIEHAEFKEELSGYAAGKGTVQFPLNQPMPLELIGKIVEFRVKQNLGRATPP